MKNSFVLFLMTEKGFGVLQAAINASYHHLIETVVIGKDKNVKNDYSEAIENLCTQNKIHFTYDKKQLEFSSKFLLCVSWRWLVPEQKNKQIIIFHESLLPKYRGFAPLVNQLINGEKNIGVSAIIASEAYDEGQIIAQSELNITYPLKIKEAIQKIIPLYQKLVVSIIENNISKSVPLSGVDQDHTKASYSLWRDDEDYKIDWNWDASKIVRHINAVGKPYNGAYCYLNGEKIIITEAQEVDDVKIENRCPGKILKMDDGQPIIVCSNGLVLIQSAHFENNSKSIFPIQKFRSRLT